MQILCKANTWNGRPGIWIKRSLSSQFVLVLQLYRCVVHVAPVFFWIFLCGTHVKVMYLLFLQGWLILPAAGKLHESRWPQTHRYWKYCR